MLKLIHRLLIGWNIQSNRKALKGRTCPHDNVQYFKESDPWSEPKPHPHPKFADKIKIRDRESREKVTCQICGVDIFRQTHKDVKDADA